MMRAKSFNKQAATVRHMINMFGNALSSNAADNVQGDKRNEILAKSGHAKRHRNATGYFFSEAFFFARSKQSLPRK